MIKEFIPTSEEERLMEMDDRIDKYIRGELTEEESAQFIKDCKSNPELKERAIAIAYLVKAIKKSK